MFANTVARNCYTEKNKKNLNDKLQTCRNGNIFFLQVQ